MVMAKEIDLFSSESVSEGHPDKVADQISDAILDAALRQDPRARIACETLVKNNDVIVAGEVSYQGQELDYEKIAREVITNIGYNSDELGFNGATCGFHRFLSMQSVDIAQGVDRSDETKQGAGDQGIMFGFACDETEELMPLPISLAHRLVEYAAKHRKSGKVKFLRPDTKSQVTIRYEAGKPVALDTVVFSTQHTEEATNEEIENFVKNVLIPEVVPTSLDASNTRFLINPTGRFVIGGPVSDCGLTGRKIIVDTYGGYSRHGGGAFSGKDPSKVDRSAAYLARYIAKNIVAAGAATKCEVQLAYAIGVADPVSVLVDTFNTGKVAESELSKVIRDIFALTPRGIIDSLALIKPIYQKTASYGHFGRENDSITGAFSWERCDKKDQIREALKL